MKKLNDKVRPKRTKKDPPKDHPRHPKGEEFTVQRLSAEVSGRRQNTAESDLGNLCPLTKAKSLTIGNIKSACERHFILPLAKNIVCNILAGEQGPSCKFLSRLPPLCHFIHSSHRSRDQSSMAWKREIAIDAQSSKSADLVPPPSRTIYSFISFLLQAQVDPDPPFVTSAQQPIGKWQ